MYRYSVNQRLIVKYLYSVSINNINYCESFAESKFDLKYVHTAK